MREGLEWALSQQQSVIKIIKVWKRVDICFHFFNERFNYIEGKILNILFDLVSLLVLHRPCQHSSSPYGDLFPTEAAPVKPGDGSLCGKPRSLDRRAFDAMPSVRRCGAVVASCVCVRSFPPRGSPCFLPAAGCVQWKRGLGQMAGQRQGGGRGGGGAMDGYERYK